MWSKEEAYMKYCTNHYKGNATWGEQHAPYVDKISAKHIVANIMNEPNLNIIPTLATLDKDNVTEMYTLESGIHEEFETTVHYQAGAFVWRVSVFGLYVASSLSFFAENLSMYTFHDRVARVQNNQYHCFKYCQNDTPRPLDATAHSLSLKQLLDYLQQYKYTTPRIIIEEDIISAKNPTLM